MPTRDEAWPEGTPNWVDLAVDNPAQAATFYTELFGWTIQDTGDAGGGYLLAFKDDRNAAGIGPTQSPGAPANWTTYFAAANADEMAQKVKAAGGQTLMDPFDVGPSGRMLLASAPDGATFGVWQGKEHNGVEVFNEPGGLAWNDLSSRDLEAAKSFYASVFDFSYDDLSSPDMAYFLFKRPADGRPVGGMGGADMLPEGVESNWCTWFAVTGCDAAAAKVTALGGSVQMEPSDSPFGRMTLVTGAQGEVFGLIDLEATSGEDPTASG